VSAVAPVVILKDRLFMYYGYLGQLGLAVAAAGCARWAVEEL